MFFVFPYPTSFELVAVFFLSSPFAIEIFVWVCVYYDSPNYFSSLSKKWNVLGVCGRPFHSQHLYSAKVIIIRTWSCLHFFILCTCSPVYWCNHCSSSNLSQTYWLHRIVSVSGRNYAILRRRRLCSQHRLLENVYLLHEFAFTFYCSKRAIIYAIGIWSFIVLVESDLYSTGVKISNAFAVCTHPAFLPLVQIVEPRGSIRVRRRSAILQKIFLKTL